MQHKACEPDILRQRVGRGQSSSVFLDDREDCTDEGGKGLVWKQERTPGIWEVPKREKSVNWLTGSPREEELTVLFALKKRFCLSQRLYLLLT